MANLLAQNKFAALAEVEEAGEPAADLEPEELPFEEEAADEAVAAKQLEVLLTSWAGSCPTFGGSIRQAACKELEAMIAWLPTQCTLHPGPAWQAAVARQLSGCEEALLSLAAWRTSS